MQKIRILQNLSGSSYFNPFCFLHGNEFSVVDQWMEKKENFDCYVKLLSVNQWDRSALSVYEKHLKAETVILTLRSMLQEIKPLTCLIFVNVEGEPYLFFILNPQAPEPTFTKIRFVFDLVMHTSGEYLTVGCVLRNDYNTVLK